MQSTSLTWTLRRCKYVLGITYHGILVSQAQSYTAVNAGATGTWD